MRNGSPVYQDRQAPSPKVDTGRRAITALLAITFGAALLKLGHMVLSFLRPTIPANSYSGIIDGGTLQELPPVGGQPKLFPEGRFWLVHDKPGIWAVHSSCTHLECRFRWDSEKQLFICPCHGSEFTREGQILKGPAEQPLNRFAVSLYREGEEESPLKTSQHSEGAPIAVSDLLNAQHEQPSGVKAQTAAATIVIRVDTGKKLQPPF